MKDPDIGPGVDALSAWVRAARLAACGRAGRINQNLKYRNIRQTGRALNDVLVGDAVPIS
jgi:hypothetical protein